MSLSPRLRVAWGLLHWREHFFTTVETDFGKRLTQARKARGLTIEEASDVTHVRPGMLRALEEGNLAYFPNAAYAKSFLLLYAKHLGVDVKEAARGIDTATQMRVEDFQYLSNLATEERRQQRLQKKEAKDSRYDFVIPQKHGGSWLPLIIVAVAAGLGLVGFVVWNNLNRLADRPASGPAATASPVPPAPMPAEIARPKENPADPPAPNGHIPPVAPPAGNDVPAMANGAAPATVDPAAQAPDLPPLPTEEGEVTNVPLDPGTIVLEPHRKTWVTIRTGPGGQLLYEDFLYPSAKAMHLPPGRYFIELKDAGAVEVSKDGKILAYTVPGILVN